MAATFATIWVLWLEANPSFEVASNQGIQMVAIENERGNLSTVTHPIKLYGKRFRRLKVLHIYFYIHSSTYSM